MKIILLIFMAIILMTSQGFGQSVNSEKIVELDTDDMHITQSSVVFHQDLELVVFEIIVKGTAGGTVPEENGQINGAPVLGYVFPTTLSPQDVGFGPVEGILALAVTSHPDFDDTPLWDENNDADFGNDGYVFHSHWVVLVNDNRVSGNLSVKSLDLENPGIKLPATHPGMPIYLDSPGFSVVLKNNSLKVLVPAQRINYKTEFNYDCVTAYMQVSKDENMPMLGVYHVYQVQSTDLSLPYKVNVSR